MKKTPQKSAPPVEPVDCLASIFSCPPRPAAADPQGGPEGTAPDCGRRRHADPALWPSQTRLDGRARRPRRLRRCGRPAAGACPRPRKVQPPYQRLRGARIDRGQEISGPAQLRRSGPDHRSGDRDREDSSGTATGSSPRICWRAYRRPISKPTAGSTRRSAPPSRPSVATLGKA